MTDDLSTSPPVPPRARNAHDELGLTFPQALDADGIVMGKFIGAVGPTTFDQRSSSSLAIIVAALLIAML